MAWPGLLEPSYLMGPSYFTLRVSDLWPGHSALGVSMQMGQVGREQTVKPGQRGQGLEEGHDDQAERPGRKTLRAWDGGRGHQEAVLGQNQG